MNLLLDTHALLWILNGDPRLSTKAIQAYEQAESVSFSMVSLWEIGIKLGLRKKQFSLAEGWSDRIPTLMTEQGVTRINIEPEHCKMVSELPLHHRDPFDRLLIAQAITAKATLLSCDSWLEHYEVNTTW